MGYGSHRQNIYDCFCWEGSFFGWLTNYKQSFASGWVGVSLCLQHVFFMLISLHVDNLMRHISTHPSPTSVYLLYLHDILHLLDIFCASFNFKLGSSIYFCFFFICRPSVSFIPSGWETNLASPFPSLCAVLHLISHKALLQKNLQGCNFKEWVILRTGCDIKWNSSYNWEIPFPWKQKYPRLHEVL